MTPSREQLEGAIAALRRGGVVLLPTDTIYGLHALADDPEAIAKVVELKGRGEDKPFVVIAASVAQLEALGVDIQPRLRQALTSLWPAPLTAILPLTRPVAASRGTASLAVRVPALEWLRDLLEQTGPLASTSANRSGEPPIKEPAELASDLQIRLDSAVDLGVYGAEPSALLDFTGSEPRFIRERDVFFTQNVWKTLRKSL